MGFEKACIENGLIIDTNLLILLLVGHLNIDYIKDCTKTSNFKIDDFVYIDTIIRALQPTIIVTPHILAEVSNITFKKMFYGQKFERYFQEVCAFLQLASEKHVAKEDIMNNLPLLSRIGFTDLSIIEAAKTNGYAVLTNDLPFHAELVSAGCKAVDLKGAQVFAAAHP